MNTTLKEIESLEELGKGLKGKLEYRRWQCVLLRMKHEKGVDEIADLLQLHRRTVYKHLERYRMEGLATFEYHKPGTKPGPKLMTRDEEKALLQSLESQAGKGQLLTGVHVKKAIEEKVGKPVATSMVYLFLHRNGWSKQKPRPRHPQGDEEAKSLFKKIR